MAPEARGVPFFGHLARLVGSTAFAACICISLAETFTPPAHAAELTAWTPEEPLSFRLSDIQGAGVTLAAQQADAVLVHFFATWCEPCRDELPALNRLSQRGGSSLRIIAISVAEPGLRVQRFLQTLPVDFPVLLDGDRAVTKAWKISSLPTTAVLNSRLEPRLIVESDYAWDTTDPKQLIDRVSQGASSHQQDAQQGGLAK